MKLTQQLKASQKLLALPLLTFCLLTTACSAKEAAVLFDDVAVTTAEAAQEAVTGAVNKATQEVVKRGEVDERYAALFGKATEAVALGLENNPDNFVAGTHYDVLEKRQAITTSGDKIEVAEFFSYGCGHCFNAEPYMHAYAGQVADDVTFVRIPASFNKPFELLARGFHAANALGVDEEAHIALFDAIHIKKRQNLMQSEGALADFYAAYGVDKDKFSKSLYSFSINGLIERDKKLTAAYQINGVPAVVVNGAYNTSGGKAGNLSTWFQILDVLTEKERVLKAAK